MQGNILDAAACLIEKALEELNAAVKRADWAAVWRAKQVLESAQRLPGQAAGFSTSIAWLL